MLQNWDLILPPRLTSYNVITHKGWGRPPLPPAVYKHCMDPLGLSEDPLCNHMTQKPKTNIAQQAQRFSRPRGSKVLDFYKSSAAPAWRSARISSGSPRRILSTTPYSLNQTVRGWCLRFLGGSLGQQSICSTEFAAPRMKMHRF